MSSTLNIGRSALIAAQAGIMTTGHNIANASTPGYTRQTAIQTAAPAQRDGAGYLGGGTVVSEIRRSYNDLLTSQVRSSQSSQSASSTYFNHIATIDSLFGDGTSGIAPSVQDLFKGVQGLTTDPLSAASRQAVLSSAETMTSQFRSFSAQLNESKANVNSEIGASVQSINSYAKQISSLNDSISLAVSSGQTPNDLMDQRDQAVLELSKEVKASVVSDGKSGFNIFIGNGQPLVVGGKVNSLVTINSPTDPNRLEVAYSGNGNSFELPENSLGGGNLGGLFDFRAKTLDVAQNTIGRMAIVLGDTLNAQNKLGLDQTGKPGAALFNIGAPVVTPGSKNQSNASASAVISSSVDLTTSDYRMKFDGTDYTVTRLSDGQATKLAGIPQTIDGVTFGIASGAPSAGDEFLIQPTVAGANNFSVRTSDVRMIATASPVVSGSATGNVGSGKISPVVVDKSFIGAPLTSSISLSISAGAAAGSFVVTGFPDGSTQPFSPGSPMAYGGMNFSMNGNPVIGDKFTLSPSSAGAKDGSNALLMGSLQSSKTVGGVTTYEGTFADLVSNVGNKARELKVTSAADAKILTEAVNSQQSESGVNLDEEAANLMKYQQAYQAAGKLMQTASTLFDTLLSLGR